MNELKELFAVLKEGWSMVNIIFAVVVIPLIKYLGSKYQSNKNYIISKLDEIEQLFENKEIKAKPRFFKDEYIRKFKEFRNLNFDFLFYIVKEKDLSYSEVVTINKNLSPAFTYLVIYDKKISAKDVKHEKILNRNLLITQIMYWGIFLLFGFFVALAITFVQNKLFYFFMIACIVVYEILLMHKLDMLKQNILLKQQCKDKYAIWADV